MKESMENHNVVTRWWLWTIIFSSLYPDTANSRLLEFEQGCSNLRPSTSYVDLLVLRITFTHPYISWPTVSSACIGRPRGYVPQAG